MSQGEKIDFEGNIFNGESQYLQSFFDSQVLCVLVLSKELVIKKASKAAAGKIGQKSLEGQFLGRFLSEENAEILAGKVSLLFASGEPQSCIAKLVDSAGKDHESTLSLELIDVGGDQLALCSIQECGVQEKLKLDSATKELTKSAQEAATYKGRLASAMRSGNIIWWEFEVATGRVEYYENADCVLGLPPNGIASNSELITVVHPDDIREAQESMNRCLRGLGEYDVTYRKRTSKGDYAWFHDHGRITRVDENGRPTLVSGAAMDITERVEKEQKIAEHQRRFESLIDFVPMGIIFADSEGTVVKVNRAAENILAFNGDELVGHKISETTWPILRRDKSEMPTGEYASVKSLAEGRLIENSEMGVTKPNGEIAWLNMSAGPTSISGYDLAIAFQDISAMVRNEDRLRQNEEKLSIYLNLN